MDTEKFEEEVLNRGKVKKPKSSSFQFKGQNIPIFFITEPSGKYITPKYHEIQQLIRDRNIKTIPWKQTLEWFFFHDRKIPLREKRSINRIGVIENRQEFIVETEESKVTYQELEYLAKNSGWYFYLTGVRLGSSTISKLVDQVKKKFSLVDIEEKWEVNKGDSINLINIYSSPNGVCFLLKIGSFSLLLDAGFPISQRNVYIDRICSITDQLDVIFLSHAHYDHYQGLREILKTFPGAIILCTAVTLDYYTFKNAEKMWSVQGIEKTLKVSSLPLDVIANAVVVKSEDEIQLLGGKLSFFSAGHMPGALMFFIQVSKFSFLYSGDFSFYDYFPISGVKHFADVFPKHVNFALIDAAMAHLSYNAPGYIFQSLFRRLKTKALYQNQVLIGADSASTAIVLYISIFRYFRNLQLDEGFEERPLIVMGRNTLEYAKIIQNRLQDLHPYTRGKMKKGLNPFTSALTRFCETGSQVYAFLNQKNTIFIFGPPDFKYGIVQDILINVGKRKHNLIYLAGALRNTAAIELVSGNNEILVKGELYQNKAEIYNVNNPEKILNFHADLIQLSKFIDIIQPKKIGFFHTDPRLLVPLRAKLQRNNHLVSTNAFPREMKILNLNNCEKGYS